MQEDTLARRRRLLVGAGLSLAALLAERRTPPAPGSPRVSASITA